MGKCRYGQGWPKVSRSRWVRLIGLGWMICLVGGCGNECRSRVGVGRWGKFGHIWARVGKVGQVGMGQTDWAEMDDMSSGCVCFCRFRGVCGWVWASFGRYRQQWAKFGKSGLVRLIGQGWVIYLAGGYGCACRFRSSCGWLWAS